MITGRKVVSNAQLLQNRAVVANTNDAVWNPLYDYQLYVTAGQLQLSYFANPIGQGTTSHPGGAGPKTLADTNMQNASMLPKGNALYCVGIEITYYPVTLPGRGAIATAAAAFFTNDVYVISRSGFLNFRVQNRDITTDAPLMAFPGSHRLGGFAALSDATTAAASLLTDIDYAQPIGATYELNPVVIEANQAFAVTLNWPNLITTPSGASVRVGVRLLGQFIRKAQ